MTSLLVATGNQHKLEEFRRILLPLGVEVLSPVQAGVELDVEETGSSFLDNARIKARAYYNASGLPAVADDSGLCVDALDGRPGVHSARYHGEHTPYAEKMDALLRELGEVPDQKRSARFACAICCVLDGQTELVCEETCEGAIARAPMGQGGFGYDPLFLVGEESFASLSPEKKDEISHRGRALRKFAELLREEMGGREPRG